MDNVKTLIRTETHVTWNQPPMSAYSTRTATCFTNSFSSTAAHSSLFLSHSKSLLHGKI